MQIIVAAVPGQEAITRDNVTVKVDAVVYYRVIDPVKAIINVQNHTYAIVRSGAAPPAASGRSRGCQSSGYPRTCTGRRRLSRRGWRDRRL